MPQVIAIGGGKGGVGKTQVSINLAACFAKSGLRTALLDADFGLANIDVVLGLEKKTTLEDILAGRQSIQDAFLEGPYGVKILPGASGVPGLANISLSQNAQFIHSLDTVKDQFDYMIVDTAAGVHATVLQCMSAADMMTLVVSNDPASLADTYAMIKLLHQSFGLCVFPILLNRIRSPQEGYALFAKLNTVATQFLPVFLELVDILPEDPCVFQALHARSAVLERYPGSAIGKAYMRTFYKIQKILSHASANGSAGRIRFFETMV